ncbi:MAG: DsbA family protein [Anaerolineaceae bacterium]|nr:DsbA family protein [Anaerolineaceae bacterium]
MNDANDAAAPEVQESAPPVARPRRGQRAGVLVVAALFLLLGFLIGRWSSDVEGEETRAWLNATLQQEFARQETRLQEMMLAARPPDLNDSSTRFAVSAGERPALGPEAAGVEIIEFGDFNCGFCARFHSETLPQIRERYGDQVRIVYRDFPLLGDTSTEAAIAARCAEAQDNFWPYHDLLFENQGTLGEPGIFLNYARALDLDPIAFNNCLVEQQPIESIAADFRDAQDLGIRGTPAFFINGRPLLGAREFEAFARIIDEELAAAG